MSKLTDYNPDPYSAGGEWFKCCFHLHTTCSDGHLSPEEVRNLYSKQGYDVVCLTDHNTLAPVEGLSNEDILVMPGEEVNPLCPPIDRSSIHIVGINLKEAIPAHTLTASLIMHEIREQDAVPVFAHPAWGGYHLDEILGVDGYVAIEVYNRLSEKHAKGYSEGIWDQILDLRGHIWGLAVDDMHNTDTAFGGWVWLKAEERTPDAVVNALKNGSFYASQGPKIFSFNMELSTATSSKGEKRKAWKVSAETEPAKMIKIVTNGDWGRWAPAPENETITTAERILSKHAHWVRLEVIDANNKKAWSNPLMLPPVPEE